MQEFTKIICSSQTYAELVYNIQNFKKYSNNNSMSWRPEPRMLDSAASKTPKIIIYPGFLCLKREGCFIRRLNEDEEFKFL
jgi:hypothetical protein